MGWSDPDGTADTPEPDATRRSARPTLYLALAAAALVLALALVGISRIGSGAPRPDPAADDDALARAATRVEVLNGAGVGGLARTATRALRDGGFDVVFFGNAARFDHDRSVVLDRIGSPAQARAIAHLLGIDSVDLAVDSTLLLDVTVILGSDWPPPEPAPEGPLGRLRALLGGA